MSKSDEMCIVVDEDGNTESRKNLDKQVSSEKKCQEGDKKQLIRSLKFLTILVILQLLSYIVTYQLPVFLRPRFSASEVWETMHLKLKSWIVLGSFLTRSVLWIIIIILNGTFSSFMVKKVRALTLLVPLSIELFLIVLIASSLLSSHDSEGTSHWILYGFSLFFSTLIVCCIIKMIFACYEDCDHTTTMTTTTTTIITGTDNHILDSKNETTKDSEEMRKKTVRKLLSFWHFSSTKPAYQRSYNEGRKL